jgi:hypothetical protein
VRDGDQVITLHPQGRFKADNGQALLFITRMFDMALAPSYLEPILSFRKSAH